MKRLNVSDLIDQTPIKHSIRETDTEYVEEVAEGEFALDMERIVAEVLSSGARVAPDLRIDDRDLKEFPNFYEWCFSKDGGNQAPFAKQLALATHLMAEWCPRCSHKAFRNIHKIPVNFPAKDFPDKVQFLHHGVCPKCGARKSELVKSGELNAYVELDVCAGQRCITGDSLILTATGYKRIKDLLPGADYGYTDKLSLVHNGKELTYMTKFFRAKAEPLYKITLRSGLTIIGTKDHPVKTNEGFVKLPDLLGKYVETPVGTNVYGSNVLTNEQLAEYLDYDYIPDCILQATKDIQMKFLRMIGVDFGNVFRIRNRKMLNDVALLLRNMGYETIIRSTTMQVSEVVYKQTYKYDRCVFVEPYAEEETFDIRVPNGSTFIANGILNHNSGKSAFFNLLVPYLTHKWVKVEKPVETLGLMSSSILIGTCTALTWAKAQELLYEPISNAIENSKWFQQYFQLLDDYEERTGIELYKFKDTFLSFNHKNLILNTSGPNKRTLRGATRWISVIDEIGWFPHGDDNDERERASANEVYVSLDRSLKTVRKSTMKLLKEGYDNIPLAYGCGISSPSSYNDKIMELVRNFKGSKEVLVHQAPTWEMNPLFTKEDFAKEYQDDPIKAERDFGANPPMAENAWISDVKSLDHLLVNRWVIDYQYDHFTNRSGVDMVFGKLRSTKAPPTCPPTVLTIDAGYSNNSFALAITANDGRGANVLAVAEIAPKKGITVINYTRTVKQLLYPLIKAFNVQAVGADRWNSLKLLQDIEEDCHVQTFQYSLKPTDFDLVYDYLMEDLPAIKLPRPEMDLGQIFVTSDYPHGFKYKPNSHLYHQFSTVNVDGRGSVEKGNGYTDDILRAVALGIRTCVLEDTIKKFNLRGATKQTKYAIGARSGSAQATSSSTIGSKTGSSGSGSFGSRG
jgi:hypothetical protein